jgi:hypothetical protein
MCELPLIPLSMPMHLCWPEETIVSLNPAAVTVPIAARSWSRIIQGATYCATRPSTRSAAPNFWLDGSHPYLKVILCLGGCTRPPGCRFIPHLDGLLEKKKTLEAAMITDSIHEIMTGRLREFRVDPLLLPLNYRSLWNKRSEKLCFNINKPLVHMEVYCQQAYWPLSLMLLETRMNPLHQVPILRDEIVSCMLGK